MSQDLTKLILNTYVENTFSGKRFANKKIATIDKVFLPSFNEVNKQRKIYIIKKASDFAYMTNLYQHYNFNAQKNMAEYYLRNPVKVINRDYDLSLKINTDGEYDVTDGTYDSNGIVPSINVDINEFLKIRETLPNNGEVLDVDMPSKKGVNHTLRLGEYPQTIVEPELEIVLEELFNNGNLKDGLESTGRMFTSFRCEDNISSRQNPEFIYKGEKYVRVVANTSWDHIKCSNGRFMKNNKPYWVKVEPIEFKIKNWEKLPKSINPKGKGKAKALELESMDILMSGIAFFPDEDVKYLNLWQNSIIRAFLNSSSNQILGQNPKFSHGLDWDFSENGFLQQAFNLSREPIIEYTIPHYEKKIDDHAFDGCVSLKKIIVPPHVKYISSCAFTNCNINYVYMNRVTGNVEFVEDLPQDLNECIGVCDLKKLNKTIKLEDYSMLLSAADLRKLNKLCDILDKNKMTIHEDTAKELMSNIRFETFINNSDFRFFKNELKDTLSDLQESSFVDIDEPGFYKFAALLGCFSKQRVINKHGKETQAILAQKASSFMAQMLKSNIVRQDEFADLVDDFPLAYEPNQDFLKFISQVGEGGKFVNLDMLLTLNKGGYRGIFAKVMTQFDKVKNYRTTLGPNGIPVTVPWLDAITKFDEDNAFYGVTPENMDIAKEFSSRGLEQDVFMEAVNMRNLAKEKNIPEHILGEELKEDTILESIEKIKQSTNIILQDSQKVIDDLYAKRFTYEMLSKYDPKNAIMGLYTSCCGTITSSAYGADIAKASIIEDDVQNLVIRNYNGEIVAKGTIYVNKDKGYAVINDFEISSVFKHNEYGIGFYDVKSDSSEEKDRDMIFKAFMRGIHAFVVKYDKQNPDKPIQYVNVGLGHNRLQEQCSKFEEATKILSVPSEYQFCDAQDLQKVLYDRKKHLKNLTQGRDVQNENEFRTN